MTLAPNMPNVPVFDRFSSHFHLFCFIFWLNSWPIWSVFDQSQFPLQNCTSFPFLQFCLFMLTHTSHLASFDHFLVQFGSILTNLNFLFKTLFSLFFAVMLTHAYSYFTLGQFWSLFGSNWVHFDQSQFPLQNCISWPFFAVLFTHAYSCFFICIHAYSYISHLTSFDHFLVRIGSILTNLNFLFKTLFFPSFAVLLTQFYSCLLMLPTWPVLVTFCFKLGQFFTNLTRFDKSQFCSKTLYSFPFLQFCLFMPTHAYFYTSHLTSFGHLAPNQRQTSPILTIFVFPNFTLFHCLNLLKSVEMSTFGTSFGHFHTHFSILFHHAFIEFFHYPDPLTYTFRDGTRDPEIR